MNTNPLTPAQHFILAAAIEHTDGRIERFPDNIKGGARSKVLFTLAGFEFDFRDKPRFTARDQVSREYLLVDMLNNLEQLAEDSETLLDAVHRKLDTFDAARLEQALRDYGSARTRRLFRPWMSEHDAQA